MLDIGWTEMLMIAVVAIVVIGPKDLPRTLRTIGQWIGKARAMTRDLQNSVNDMIADSELEELHKASSSMSDFSPEGYFKPAIDGGASPGEEDDAYDDYPTPPPTPLKWPPDDEEAAATDATPDVPGSDAVDNDTPANESDTPAKITDV